MVEFQDIPHLHIEAKMYLKAINGINVLKSSNEELHTIIQQLVPGKAINIDVLKDDSALRNFNIEVM